MSIVDKQSTTDEMSKIMSKDALSRSKNQTRAQKFFMKNSEHLARYEGAIFDAKSIGFPNLAESTKI